MFKDYLLDSELAKSLYETIKGLPIIDYHCHLSPKEIYENKPFKNLTEVWLGGDHYKWRLLRANGVEERFITGDASDKEKFLKWAELVPYLIGNPLFGWTHMELKTFFGIEDYLNPKNALAIYEKANEKLASLPPVELIKMNNVSVVCTTDDPLDDLKYHALIKEQNLPFKVLPAWRPDGVINIELDFKTYIQDLSKVTDMHINSLPLLQKALVERMDYFHERDCRLSDHGLDIIPFEKVSFHEAEQILIKALNDELITKREIAKYKTYMLTFLGKEYHQRGWVQQYHIGALRNVNDKQLKALGKDSGYDAINDYPIANGLAGLLNALDQTDQLPKTIIYTLNPRDFEVGITIMQGFQNGVPGKLQFGAPWWFLDHEDGIVKQFKALSQNGLLSRFIGMLTDSRSFLSYPRHDYFRRILANFVANEVNKKRFPNEKEILETIVKDIAYFNASKYFSF